MSNNKVRTYNPNTTKYETVDYTEVYTFKKKYEMFNGYATNDEGLIKNTYLSIIWNLISYF